MCGAPPVARLHDPARAGKLILQSHIIKIAADRQPTVRTRLDVTMHEHLRPATGPCWPCRCGDLGKTGLRQAVGPRRLEQAIVLEIGEYDAANLLAQCSRAAGVGRRRHIAIRSKPGDGNAEVLQGNLVDHLATCQPAFFFILESGFNASRFGRLLAKVLRRHWESEGSRCKQGKE